MKPLLLIFLGAAALVAGCASGPARHTLEGDPACKVPALPPMASPAASASAMPDTPPLRARVWSCADHRPVTLYPMAGAADLLDRGCQMRVPQVPSPTGTRYENNAVSFRIDGETATLQRKPGPALSCREIALMSRIEDARIRGVTWRGHDVGGEWHIDIGPGQGFTLAQAGQAPLKFARATSVSDPNTRTTVYSARQGTDHVTVKVTDLQCRDKAGNVLPQSVDIVLNGASLEGCGVPLAR